MPWPWRSEHPYLARGWDHSLSHRSLVKTTGPTGQPANWRTSALSFDQFMYYRQVCGTVNCLIPATLSLPSTGKMLSDQRILPGRCRKTHVQRNWLEASMDHGALGNHRELSLTWLYWAWLLRAVCGTLWPLRSEVCWGGLSLPNTVCEKDSMHSSGRHELLGPGQVVSSLWA